MGIDDFHDRCDSRIVAGRTYLELYIHRFTGVYRVSAADVSSGRSDIWGRGLEAMMNSPVSLITGFGWDTWSVMGFNIVAHNHYLSLWFELGLCRHCFAFS